MKLIQNCISIPKSSMYCWNTVNYLGFPGLLSKYVPMQWSDVSGLPIVCEYLCTSCFILLGIGCSPPTLRCKMDVWTFLYMSLCIITNKEKVPKKHIDPKITIIIMSSHGTEKQAHTSLPEPLQSRRPTPTLWLYRITSNTATIVFFLWHFERNLPVSQWSDDDGFNDSVPCVYTAGWCL